MSPVPAAPRTSVILPAYNSEATLLEAVESALAQTVAELELLVVDDGSRVPAAEVLAGQSDERLHVIRKDPNEGVARARNTALAAARAPLISTLDSDDAWEPGYLESILPSFDDPAVGMAYANAKVIGNPEHAVYIDDPSPHPIDRFPELAHFNPAPATTVTMRRDAARAVGGWATWVWGGTDYHMYLKLAAAGWRFAYVDRVLARYRYPEPGRGMTWDRRRAERSELKMWIVFGMRHPFLPLRRFRLYGRHLRRNVRHLPGVRSLRAGKIEPLRGP